MADVNQNKNKDDCDTNGDSDKDNMLLMARQHWLQKCEEFDVLVECSRILYEAGEADLIPKALYVALHARQNYLDLLSSGGNSTQGGRNPHQE